MTMLLGLFQRLFGATRDAISLPNFDAGNKAVEISTTILRECIDLGFAGPDGPNRGRLAQPFARGYLFGFSAACIERLGVLDELESLALITLVHTRIFGHKFGSLLVGDALRGQRNTEFSLGATVGAEELLRWLNDRSDSSFLLTDYLLMNDETSSLVLPSTASTAGAASEPQNAPSPDAPSRWNTPGGKRAIVKAGPGQSATIIRLPARPRAQSVKPIKR